MVGSRGGWIKGVGDDGGRGGGSQEVVWWGSRVGSSQAVKSRLQVKGW